MEPPASPNQCVLAEVCYQHFGEQKGFSGIYWVCHRKFRSDPQYWLFLSRSSKPLKSHELRKEILTVLMWSLLEKSFPSASICSAYLPCSIFGEVVAWLLGRGRDKKKKYLAEETFGLTYFGKCYWIITVSRTLCLLGVWKLGILLLPRLLTHSVSPVRSWGWRASFFVSYLSSRHTRLTKGVPSPAVMFLKSQLQPSKHNHQLLTQTLPRVVLWSHPARAT